VGLSPGVLSPLAREAGRLLLEPRAVAGVTNPTVWIEGLVRRRLWPEGGRVGRGILVPGRGRARRRAAAVSREAGRWLLLVPRVAVGVTNPLVWINGLVPRRRWVPDGQGPRGPEWASQRVPEATSLVWSKEWSRAPSPRRPELGVTSPLVWISGLAVAGWWSEWERWLRSGLGQDGRSAPGMGVEDPRSLAWSRRRCRRWREMTTDHSPGEWTVVGPTPA
jgi:hypothetical protein